MTEFGYWLSSEEHAPIDLVRNAARAEELGFSFAMVSDHSHPWIDALATEHVPCGPDPEPVVVAVRAWERAGFDRIALHQVGSDQAGFFRFWEGELQPRLTLDHTR